METCKPSCALPHQSLPRLFPSIENTENQTYDCRRVGKPALLLEPVSSNQDQTSRAISVCSWQAGPACGARDCRSKRRFWRSQLRRNGDQRSLTACRAVYGISLVAANLAHLVSTSPTYSIVPTQVEKLEQRSTIATTRSTA
jgi:hypothetical protein